MEYTVNNDQNTVVWHLATTKLKSSWLWWQYYTQWNFWEHKRKHQCSAVLAILEESNNWPVNFRTRASNWESIFMSWCHHWKTYEIQFNHKPTKIFLTKKAVSQNGLTLQIIGIWSYSVLHRLVYEWNRILLHSELTLWWSSSLLWCPLQEHHSVAYPHLGWSHIKVFGSVLDNWFKPTTTGCCG